MYDPELSALIDRAFTRLNTRAQEAAPFLGKAILNWLRGFYQGGKPEEAFKHPHSFPVLLLPWYAEASLRPEPDEVFQGDLVYSTVNGYLYIRLMDNLMDGHDTEELSLLPTLTFFHTQFHSPYQLYFQHDHPFWADFTAIWFNSAEVTMRDAEMADIDRKVFVEVSSRKSCAAKIPLVAVFHRYEHPERIEAWSSFVDTFGCWHQMWNDLFDWAKDLQHGTQTYFLSEAHRRARSGEPIAEWVIREGFDWGIEVLDSWMLELGELAAQLDSPPLQAFLQKRDTAFSRQKDQASQGLKQMGKLLVGIKNALDTSGS